MMIWVLNGEIAQLQSSLSARNDVIYETQRTLGEKEAELQEKAKRPGTKEPGCAARVEDPVRTQK